MNSLVQKGDKRVFVFHQPRKRAKGRLNKDMEKAMAERGVPSGSYSPAKKSSTCFPKAQPPPM
jgi:hypothetical protein